MSIAAPARLPVRLVQPSGLAQQVDGADRGGGKVVGTVFRVRHEELAEAEAPRREIEKPEVQRRGERKVRLETKPQRKPCAGWREPTRRPGCAVPRSWA